MTEHIRAVHAANDDCPENDGRPCAVCNPFICTVYGGSEGSLLPECPGRQLTFEEDQENYKHYCNSTGPFAKSGLR